MIQSKGRLKLRFPITISSGEFVNSLEEYKNSCHFKKLIRQYQSSTLNQCCYSCRSSADHMNYEHRTICRLGKERLTDISPICDHCKSNSFSTKLREKGKKKAERFALNKFAFNPSHLTEGRKDWLLSIHPKQRGQVLTLHYFTVANQYKPSSYWINAQVKKTCKWINKTEQKTMKLEMDEV